MAKAETTVYVTTATKPEAAPSAMQMQMWRPFESLRREVDRLFEDFTMSPLRLPFRRPAFDIEPFWSPESWIAVPEVDFVEREAAYEVHADLPGMDEKDIEVKARAACSPSRARSTRRRRRRSRTSISASAVRRVRAGVPGAREGEADKIEAASRRACYGHAAEERGGAKPVKTIEVKGE